MNQARYEDAIAAWLSEATQLPWQDTATGAVARIFPKFQHEPQPPLPYLTFLVPSPWATGPDERRKTYDSKAPPGQEMKVFTRGEREFTCTVDAYTETATGRRNPEGYVSAGMYLARAIDYLALPSIVRQLQAAGLVVIDRGSPNDFSMLGGAVGMGRANVAVRFRCVSSVSESEGYIETATLTVNGE